MKNINRIVKLKEIFKNILLNIRTHNWACWKGKRSDRSKFFTL